MVAVVVAIFASPVFMNSLEDQEGQKERCAGARSEVILYDLP